MERAEGSLLFQNHLAHPTTSLVSEAVLSFLLTDSCHVCECRSVLCQPHRVGGQSCLHMLPVKKLKVTRELVVDPQQELSTFPSPCSLHPSINFWLSESMGLCAPTFGLRQSPVVSACLSPLKILPCQPFEHLHPCLRLLYVAHLCLRAHSVRQPLRAGVGQSLPSFPARSGASPGLLGGVCFQSQAHMFPLSLQDSHVCGSGGKWACMDAQGAGAGRQLLRPVSRPPRTLQTHRWERCSHVGPRVTRV